MLTNLRQFSKSYYINLMKNLFHYNYSGTNKKLVYSLIVYLIVYQVKMGKLLRSNYLEESSSFLVHSTEDLPCTDSSTNLLESNRF